MALSQIKCLDENNVNLRMHESKPEFLYSEEQRLALETLLRDGREAFAKFLQGSGLRCFLSDQEVDSLTGAVQVYEPGSELLGVDSDSDDLPLSLQYWPDLSDFSLPRLDLGWPDSAAYRGVTRVTVYAQPPLDGITHIKEVVRKSIGQAQKVIAVVMDQFTDMDIFRDLLEAGLKRRVWVYILLERTALPQFMSMAERSAMHPGHLKNLRVCVAGGTEFFSRSCTSVKGKLGHRFLFIDGDKAMSGSYSFTWTASRLDRHLVTMVTGQAVDSFDRLFRDLYLTSSEVDLRRVAVEKEPVPEPLSAAPPVAQLSAIDARKLFSPKYALMTGHATAGEARDASSRRNSNSQNCLKTKERVSGPVEVPTLHPGLACLEKVYLVSYLPTWPEPDPSSDVIGFINIRDPLRPTQVHLQRSERFETSQAIRFSSPVLQPTPELPPDPVAARPPSDAPSPTPSPPQPPHTPHTPHLSISHLTRQSSAEGKPATSQHTKQVTPPQPQSTPPQSQLTPPQLQSTPPQSQLTPPQPQLKPPQPQATPPQSQLTSSQPQSTPPQSQLTTPQPQLKPPQPQSTPPQPQSTPPQPQLTSPQPQSTPPQSQLTPPQPQTTPPQLQSTPPQSQLTPPQPQLTPPQPQTTPPQPQSTPPQAQSMPHKPQLTPPQPSSTPPQLQSTSPQPQSMPPQPQSTPPQPQLMPPQLQLTPPQTQSKPPKPKLTPPQPQLTPPQPQSMPPQPQLTPPQPQLIPPQPQSMSPQPQIIPAQPRLSPSQPQSAVPQPKLTPPQTQSTPPQPRSTPSQPQSTPPQPQLTPPQTQSTPPQTQSAPSQPQSTPPQPQLTPPQTQSTPPKPRLTPPQPQLTPPQPQSMPPQPQLTPPQPQLIPPRPQSMPPQPQITPAQPRLTPSQPQSAVPQPKLTPPQTQSTPPPTTPPTPLLTSIVSSSLHPRPVPPNPPNPKPRTVQFIMSDKRGRDLCGVIVVKRTEWVAPSPPRIGCKTALPPQSSHETAEQPQSGSKVEEGPWIPSACSSAGGDLTGSQPPQGECVTATQPQKYHENVTGPQSGLESKTQTLKDGVMETQIERYSETAEHPQGDLSLKGANALDRTARTPDTVRSTHSPELRTPPPVTEVCRGSSPLGDSNVSTASEEYYECCDSLLEEPVGNLLVHGLPCGPEKNQSRNITDTPSAHATATGSTDTTSPAVSMDREETGGTHTSLDSSHLAQETNGLLVQTIKNLKNSLLQDKANNRHIHYSTEANHFLPQEPNRQLTQEKLQSGSLPSKELQECDSQLTFEARGANDPITCQTNYSLKMERDEDFEKATTFNPGHALPQSFPSEELTKMERREETPYTSPSPSPTSRDTEPQSYTEETELPRLQQGPAELFREKVERPAESHTERPLESEIERLLASQTERLVASQTERLVASQTERLLASQTERPVKSQTERPVKSQTERPVENQSERPVESQTERSVENQTERSVENQTERPLQSQTERPVEGQTERPVESLTESSVVSLTESSVARLTESSVASLTERPAESQPESPAESHPERPAQSQPERPAESQPERPAESQPERPAESQPERPAESHPERPAESPVSSGPKSGHKLRMNRDTGRRKPLRAPPRLPVRGQQEDLSTNPPSSRALAVTKDATCPPKTISPFPFQLSKPPRRRPGIVGEGRRSGTSPQSLDSAGGAPAKRPASPLPERKTSETMPSRHSSPYRQPLVAQGRTRRRSSTPLHSDIPSTLTLHPNSSTLTPPPAQSHLPSHTEPDPYTWSLTSTQSHTAKESQAPIRSEQGDSGRAPFGLSYSRLQQLRSRKERSSKIPPTKKTSATPGDNQDDL